MSQNPHPPLLSVHANQPIATGNILSAMPVTAPAAELFETLLGQAGMEIERIVSFGHASPPGFWYDQAQAEWVMLIQGEATLQIEGRPDLQMHAGDYCNIPAHVRHRVAWTTPDQPTVWLAIFYSGTEGSKNDPSVPE